MALSDFSKPGSWSSRLYNILRPAPHPLAIQFANSRSNFRHLPGEIWRQVLSCSVYHDLAGEQEIRKQAIPTNGQIAQRRTWRRFVRMECIGLSGLLIYEIRTHLSPGLNCELNYKERLPFVDNERRLDDLTVKSVFGDPDNPDDSGMAVDDLLDAVHARVIYFPAYACTSFIVGQVMTAFFRDQPSFRPRPALEGFSVPASETVENIGLFSKNENIHSESSQILSYTGPERILLPSCSWKAICEDLNDLDELTMDSDDPHAALCVRSSNRSDVSASSSHALSDEEEGDITSSTIGFAGPPTPPPLQPCSATISHPFSGRSLSMKADEKPIGFNLWTLKPSKSFPTVSSGSNRLISTHSEQVSFLDFSLSYVEMFRED